MTILRLILPDQLSMNFSSLNDCNKQDDIIFMCELMEDLTLVNYHKKKLVLVLSAMRHFLEKLRKSQYNVKYIEFDEQGNSGDLTIEVKKQIDIHNINKIIVGYPSDFRVLAKILSWQKQFNIEVEIRHDNKFLANNIEFEDWAKDKKSPRMEFFYRQMRKKHNILMYKNQPIGDRWNFDTENRESPSDKLNIPKDYRVNPDKITNDVISIVREKFKHNFGEIDNFTFAVNRESATKILDVFIAERLKFFGTYQDAMIEGEPWMYHSHISMYINIGLLMPMECIQAAQKAYFDNLAPLNAVEGFIRQILGWREYVRGIYWYKMPQYKEMNYLNATNNLPDFYWSADTKMNCVKQCVTETKNNAYAHHIQRLMVLGNFALLIGVSPHALNEWFLSVYADAYEWVELPNVSGMVLFADGGYLASKPYAAGGSYIKKMSNYCKNCSYNVNKKDGADACPFNYLYWDFLARNRGKLLQNQRLSMMYNIYSRMSEQKKNLITKESSEFIERILQKI